MLIVALGWSLLEAIRQRWSASWKTPSNRRIHQEMYIHTVGGLSTSRTNVKEQVEQIFQSWKDTVHWNDRVRQNCCQLEELGMSTGALALPTCEGGRFYSLWHCADRRCFSVTALTVGADGAAHFLPLTPTGRAAFKVTNYKSDPGWRPT